MNKRDPIQPASLIIAAMKGLLAARRERRIARGSFLKAWGRLRKMLAMTKEYQTWRWAVRNRAGGACERCGEMGHHAHHKVPISRDPDRALDLTNGELTCKNCHNDEHDGQLLRPRSPRRRPHSRSRTGRRTHRPSPARPTPNPATQERAVRATPLGDER